MARFCRRGKPRLLPVLLGVTLLAGGCQSSGVSMAGRERCRQRSEAAGDPFSTALSYWRCLPAVDRELAAERAAETAAAAAKRAAREACRQRQQKIMALMASLREAEQALAAARNTPFRPSVAPPPPLDPRKESRYRPEDQQLDRERYEAALAAWEQRVAGQRALWRQERAAQIDDAQARLDRQFQALKSLQPDLFTGPGSIEFEPAVVRRLSRGCDSTG